MLGRDGVSVSMVMKAPVGIGRSACRGAPTGMTGGMGGPSVASCESRLRGEADEAGRDAADQCTSGGDGLMGITLAVAETVEECGPRALKDAGCSTPPGGDLGRPAGAVLGNGPAVQASTAVRTMLGRLDAPWPRVCCRAAQRRPVRRTYAQTFLFRKLQTRLQRQNPRPDERAKIDRRVSVFLAAGEGTQSDDHVWL